MKKLSEIQKIRLIRRIRRNSQRIKSKNIGIKKEKDRISAQQLSFYDGNNFKVISGVSVGMPAPEILSLSNNYEETASFLQNVADGLNNNMANSVKQKILARRVLKYWDYSTIKEITIPVALMLAAQYDRTRQISNLVPRAINIEKWDPNVAGVLNAIGFLELVGIHSKSEDTYQTNIGVILKLTRGVDIKAESISQYFLKLGIDLINEDPSIYEAIIEAISNAVNHAYSHPDILQPYTVRSWWLAAELRNVTQGRLLTLIVYDQGATIPGTLPFSQKGPSIYGLLKRILGAVPKLDDSSYDGHAINCAMEVGRSQTGHENRGKGLEQIERVLDFCQRGSLTIFSRRGHFRAFKNPDGPLKRESTTMSVPVIGTAIIWRLVI